MLSKYSKFFCTIAENHKYLLLITDVNISIIGAGVVGLAIASRLSKDYSGIFVLEKNSKFGQETSSRNSEVIHSGLYYPKGSLKAKLCVQGRNMLYDLCEKNSIPYKKCGKLIVATDNEEVDKLDAIYQKAVDNDVNDLEFLDTDRIASLEPNVNGVKALFSPSTGIIDSHALMKYFESDSISSGVDFAYLTRVTEIEKIEDYYKIELIDSDQNKFSFTSNIIINSAGLEAENIAKMVGINNEKYKTYFCKGEYFSIKPPKNKLISHLVYPVPSKNLSGLGIHSTIDLGGGVKLGPNVIFLDKNICDYVVDESHKIDFYNSAKKMFPFLTLEDLQADMAGIRPKIQKPGEPIKDFVIYDEAKAGFPGFINLIAIESPGLTSSPAIAEYVASLINREL